VAAEGNRHLQTGSLAPLDWGPAALTAFGSIVAVGGTQGGYFATAWGPSAIALLVVVGLWLALGAASDATRLDGAIVLAFGLLTLWIAASVAWSLFPTRTILEVQRALVPLAGVTATLVLARGRSQDRIASAISGAIVVLCGYALVTRLLPERFGSYDPINGYRLAEPIGYWNGLGILAAIGLILVVGIALESIRGWERIAAASALVVLAPTLYFTFSRGGWLALAFGIVAMLAASPRRLANLAGLAALVPAPAVAVFAASQFEALTRQENALVEAAREGKVLLAILGACALGGTALAGALLLLERRIKVGPRGRQAVGSLVIAAVIGTAVTVIATSGGPVTVAERAIRSFEAPPPSTGPDLNDRLLTFSGSGRVDIWRAALSAREREPILGIGAGAFERVWQRDPGWIFVVRDAHSLYLEMLVELGPAGLALLLIALGIPLAACVAARRERVVPAALGAYVAYLVHAGVDWDWELTGVTLTALLIGCLGLIALRRGGVRRLAVGARIAAGLAVVGVAFVAGVGYAGNDSLDRAERALAAGNAGAAVREARLGHRLAPWSPYPLTVRGEAHLRLGEIEAAQSAFNEAVDLDGGYWRAWLGLAVATSGDERARALRRAQALYPKSREITETERLLERPAPPTG
jgi:O-antigen ligase